MAKTLPELIASFNAFTTACTAMFDRKVDKVLGKGLSTLDYTQADKDKLISMGDNTMCILGLTTAQSLDNATPTKVMFDQSFLNEGDYILEAGSIKPTKPGRYLITAYIYYQFSPSKAGVRIMANLYKNGAPSIQMTQATHESTTNSCMVTGVEDMDGVNDMIELYGRFDSAESSVTIQGGTISGTTIRVVRLS